MSYSWYRTGTCSVTSGNSRVNFQKANITTAATKPVVGDAFTIDNSDLYEVIFIGSDATGEYVMLDRNFEQASATNVKYAFMRLASSTQNAKLVAQAAEAINQKQISLEDMHEWYTLQSDEVEFTQVDGTIVKIPTWYKFNNDLGVVAPHLPDIEAVADNIDAVKAAPAAAQTATEKAAIATTKAAEADASEKAAAISAGNAAASTILMSEQEERALQAQNQEYYAASGMVHMGKSFNAATYSSVNEGLFVRNDNPNYANQVYIGASASDAIGTSKTNHSVIHIAGCVANVLNIDNGDKSWVDAAWNLPQAPDGTVIYNSTGDARGSGKATLDLKVDVDPKYGDVAADTNEAVARAFEGQLKNGDIRDGVQHWVGNNASLGVSLDTLTVTDAGVEASARQTVTTVVGETYTFTARAISPSTNTAIAAACIIVTGSPAAHVSVDDAWQELSITFTAVTSATVVQFSVWGGDIGDEASFSNASLVALTEEVVTHPVDLVMLEYCEEELTGRQEVFECIQSLSTTFGTTDVPTVLSTRPLSYFQQYDGQFTDPTKQNDKYRCVVWSDLTEPQKREIAAYMGEKLFMGINGHIVNGRLRALTERSAGNGDWLNISSLSGTLQYDANSKVKPRGNQDIATTGQYDHDPMNKGVFKSSNASVAYQGRCYLYVIGQRA